jgi:hypothetical protein
VGQPERLSRDSRQDKCTLPNGTHPRHASACPFVEVCRCEGIAATQFCRRF